ncbi:hypothetical protein DPMN_092352 [Dreissena polymorpha]|uniref:Uncharacterized protein n=1 Tax=Dreissena polymorpha TaxID=45954 RepID=A0A9D4L244_DREPO|nr:hypothetical protein DPMN_092352 [Dreissena polymorpha]
MFKVVAVVSRPEQFSASSLCLLASLPRPSGVYGVLTATWVAVKTQQGRQSGVTGVLQQLYINITTNNIILLNIKF